MLLLGVPRIVRADCGTENVNVAFIQPFLRHSHGDCFAGTLSFRYGKSVTNQVCRLSLLKEVLDTLIHVDEAY